MPNSTNKSETYSGHDRALVTVDALVKLAKDIRDRVKVQVLSNVLVLQSTASQERRRVDRSRRDNNLGSSDGELASVLSTNNSDSLALLD